MKFAYTFPPMDERELENGLRLICIPEHEQNGFVLALQMPAGRFSDPAGLEGLCELTAGLLSKGTESFSADEFSERLENAGATLFSDVGEEHSVVGLRMLASSARDLVPLFVDMMTRPRFDRDEFDRLRKEMLTALQAEAVDTAFLSTRHFYSELADGMHPAGRFQTVRSLKKITLKDVRNFFNDYIAPDGSLCVIAGDLEPETLRRFAGEQLSLWKKRRKKQGLIASSLRHPPGTVVRLVDKPDLTQTSLAVGHAAPGEKSGEKNALLLANHILGGGNFSSRLMNRIRSADGKAYNVVSQLLSETEFGALMITTSTQNGQLAGVLKSIVDEYRRFCSEGVTVEELEKARQFAIGNMAFQLEGIGNIVDKVLWLRFYGRPNSYIERFDEQINMLDAGAVNAAIRRHLSPENLIIVAVGKKAEILPALKTFGPVKAFHFRDQP